MTNVDTLSNPGLLTPAGAEPDAAWLASRPCAELTEIVERGIQGGDLFYAANREVQRRAAVAAAAAEQARAAELRRNRIMALLAILILIFCLYAVSDLLIGL